MFSPDSANALAQFNLGNMYKEVKGVIRDYAKVAEWYTKACDQAYQESCTKYKRLVK